MKIVRIACISVILLFVVLSVSARADLVGLWRFEQGSGTEANDTSGYNNHGYLYALNDPNIPSTVPKWISRVANGSQYALEFGTPASGIPSPSNPDRNWNYVYVSKSNSLSQLGTTWTIACWYKQYTNDDTINYGGGSGYQRIISCPSYEIELGVPSWLYDYFWPYNSGTWQFAMGSSQSLNVWHHMALTYDGATFKEYIDANVIFTKPVTATPLPYWDPALYLRFGSQSDPIKDLFVGALDDIAIWNQCLDINQVAKARDGNFAGPWQSATYEGDLDGSFLWDYTFIAQHANIVLSFGEKRTSVTLPEIPGAAYPSWNWQMEGNLSDANYYGLVNDGLWDGNAATIEYAAFTTVGDIIAQPKDGDYGLHWKIHKDTKYNLKVRFGGENAVNNKVGVKIYAVDPNDPNIKILLADPNRVITVNSTWYEVNNTFTAGVSHEGKVFRAECYIIKGPTGPARGSTFGHFDYVRIDVNEYLTCQAMLASGITLPYDFDGDCRVNFDDFATFANDWAMSDDPEPNRSSTELLANPDFYADKNRVPNNLNFAGGSPTGWSFSPATTDPCYAGVWNLDRNGQVNWGGGPGYYQPAGGTVAAYISTDEELRQTAASKIVQGQTYYLYAMVAGDGNNLGGYYATTVIWEYVDNTTTPTVITTITPDEPNSFVVPQGEIVWRKLTTKWTAPPAANGKYFRVRGKYGEVGGSGTMGRGLFGKISISTTKPSDWPRENLLTNGDFEDLSNLPQGTLFDQMGWINLYTYNGWTYFATYYGVPPYVAVYPPGWTFYSDNPSGFDEGGLQCQLWAPPAQPVKGRVSLWLGDGAKRGYTAVMEQKVTPTIQGGLTYYLDFVGSISGSQYNDSTWPWPVPDPNVVVELYWLAPGVSDIRSGSNGLILTLKKAVDHSLGGQGGHWQTVQTSFVADAGLDGYSFFVRAYGEPVDAPYAYFEEINLSKEAPPEIGAYTCFELRDTFGDFLTMDLNGNCVVDIYDLDLFADKWLTCNNPTGCL
jgi:hypothetical protein